MGYIEWASVVVDTGTEQRHQMAKAYTAGRGKVMFSCRPDAYCQPHSELVAAEEVPFSL